MLTVSCTKGIIALLISPPLLYAGMVSVYGYGGNLGTVYALDADTGVQLWNSQVDDAVLSVMTANSLVYVGSYANTVFAFDVSTGAKRWSTGPTIIADSVSSPTVANGHVYVVGDALYALNA